MHGERLQLGAEDEVAPAPSVKEWLFAEAVAGKR